MRLSALLFCAAIACQGQRVMVIGLDGCSPDGVRKANAPALTRMRQDGAWALKARGVMPTVSSPNWASMIMGAGPEATVVRAVEVWRENRLDLLFVHIDPAGHVGHDKGHGTPEYWLLAGPRGVPLNHG